MNHSCDVICKANAPDVGAAQARKWMVKHTGYTMIEMMVVLAIISALAAFIVPSIRQKVIDNRQNEAKLIIFEIMQKQRQFKALGDTHTFTTNLAELGYQARNDGSVLSSDEDPHFVVRAMPCQNLAISLCVQLEATPLIEGAGNSTWVMSTSDAEVRVKREEG